MMRPVLSGDVSNTARALLREPAAQRQALCARIFEQAALATAFVRRHGRLHPRYGNGSLMAAARRNPLADEPGFDNVDYCQCHVLVMDRLIQQAQARADCLAQVRLP
jgi:hypothetical protein